MRKHYTAAFKAQIVLDLLKEDAREETLSCIGVIRLSNEITVSTAHKIEVVHQSPDERIIQLWLHGRSKHTKRSYKADAKRFFKFVNKSLDTVTILDMQMFADSLVELAPATQARILSSVKSLFAFAHKEIGVLSVNVAAPIKLPAQKNTLAERILSQKEVHRMLALETNTRNSILLLLLYAGGLRVSEICGLK
ncbi:site-specific integrase [Fodinisporobacter ferrooxydans]|uniref:Site-specific integrase n=1 Tax=Fodinisporobacter ferrooxydans TaxID=2901836 RepID=A0ABY4CN75_9BACL|nr:site-specific integrase [Alicyclobacillaceae bacterium MYW30-H2]